jgi:hypothetical protein
VSFLRRAADGPEGPGQGPDRQQKSEEKASRLELVRQARFATREMKPPEPMRAIYVSIFLVAIGLVSYLSTDTTTELVKVHGKTTSRLVTVQHPEAAILLIVLALVSAGTIYWRRRLVTGIAFMLTAAIGVGTPLPKGITDATWLSFLVPAGFVLWMLIFRMNKEQKDWLSAQRAPARAAGSSQSRSSSQSRNSSRRSSQATAGSGSRKRDARATTSATGRALPPSNSRYTPPRQKPRAAQHKS